MALKMSGWVADNPVWMALWSGWEKMANHSKCDKDKI